MIIDSIQQYVIYPFSWGYDQNMKIIPLLRADVYLSADVALGVSK